jgi:hypothetical protein
MPWEPKDATRHNHAADTAKRKRQWADVANSVLARTGDEARAVRSANSVLKEGNKMMTKKKGIHLNPKHKGMLHRDLGVPEGEPISGAQLMEAMQSKSAAVRKRANFAKNARSWSHK